MLPMPLKSLDIWVCWRRRLLTSCTVVPEPRAAAVDDGGVVALPGGHGVHDGLDAGELRLVDVGGGLLLPAEGPTEATS
jgi:hypothetical protein